MPGPDFISYLKTLMSEDWSKMATSKWTVKDVVAHMVAWEKADVEVIRLTWENKKETVSFQVPDKALFCYA